jgi:hypothetical protein
MNALNDAATNFEKYMRGEPLNEELQALRDGKLNEFTLVPGARLPVGAEAAAASLNKPLDKAEREALKELRQGPGWGGLQRILQKAIRTHEESAILLSQEDPLGKQSEIAQEWAYVKIFKRVHLEVNLLVEAEIEELGHVEKQG